MKTPMTVLALTLLVSGSLTAAPMENLAGKRTTQSNNTLQMLDGSTSSYSSGAVRTTNSSLGHPDNSTSTANTILTGTVQPPAPATKAATHTGTSGGSGGARNTPMPAPVPAPTGGQ